MNTLKNRFLNLHPVIYISIYILFISLLILVKIYPYNYNLSSLIGIWKGFAETNTGLIEKGFIIFNNGGYDGQFFYLNSRFLFSGSLDNPPFLDAFFLRFNRMGMSLLTGFFCLFTGFNFYPIIALFVTTITHITAYLLLHRMLTFKYSALFFLFSIFSINANLLLVSDSLLISLVIILFYFIKPMLINRTAEITSKKTQTTIFLLSLFILLTKENGITFIIPLMLLVSINRHFKTAATLSLSLFIYYLIIVLVKKTIPAHPGTNPLSFIDLIDYPLAGFIKSINFNTELGIKAIAREFAKFPLFIFYILLILNLINIKSLRNLILFLPILFIISVTSISEVGYWLTFDNISRMFTGSIPWIILLKEEIQDYKDFGLLYFSLFLLGLLTVRIIWLKQVMDFYIY